MCSGVSYAGCCLPISGRVCPFMAQVPTDCKVSVLGFSEAPFSPSSVLRLRVSPADDGVAFELPLQHTMSEDQITWFAAGSALNNVAAAAAARA